MLGHAWVFVANAKLYDAENDGEKDIERQRERIEREADDGDRNES